MSFDPKETARLVAGARDAEREWTVEAFEAGDTTPSAYIDGWNEALEEHAKPLADQLEAAAKEIERCGRHYADIADAILPSSTGPDELVAEVRRLRTEVALMRPVVEAAVLVAELDELMDAHPRIDDPIGNDAEARLYDAVPARTGAVHAYRARKP